MQLEIVSESMRHFLCQVHILLAILIGQEQGPRPTCHVTGAPGTMCRETAPPLAPMPCLPQEPVQRLKAAPRMAQQYR